jgi:hypothetical protein
VTVHTDVSLISARARCTECEFDEFGRDAQQQAVRHVEETHHDVMLNANTFTLFTLVADDQLTGGKR